MSDVHDNSTLRAVLEDYFAQKLLRPRTIISYRYHTNRFYADVLDTPVVDVADEVSVRSLVVCDSLAQRSYQHSLGTAGTLKQCFTQVLWNHSRMTAGNSALIAASVASSERPLLQRFITGESRQSRTFQPCLMKVLLNLY